MPYFLRISNNKVLDQFNMKILLKKINKYQKIFLMKMKIVILVIKKKINKIKKMKINFIININHAINRIFSRNLLLIHNLFQRFLKNILKNE